MMKTEKETIYTYNIFIFFINIPNLVLEIHKYRDQNKLLYSLNFKGSLSHGADTRIVNVFCEILRVSTMHTADLLYYYTHLIMSQSTLKNIFIT